MKIDREITIACIQIIVLTVLAFFLMTAGVVVFDYFGK